MSTCHLCPLNELFSVIMKDLVNVARPVQRIASMLVGAPNVSSCVVKHVGKITRSAKMPGLANIASITGQSVYT
jgi:hypothetical protein